ncbi:MAG: hypothetical protein ACYCX4_02665 [Bacillota bacterium]
MNNTLITISKYLEDNYATIGLAAKTDLKLIENPKSTLTNGGRWLVVLSLRTLPDSTRGVPFGNMVKTGVAGERFLTVLEIECKTRAADPGKDFYWNTARQLRDSLYNLLAGSKRTGRTIPRKTWADPDHPVEAGEIWFKVDEKRGMPREDPLEDENDPANKSIYLTYEAHWWKPLS